MQERLLVDVVNQVGCTSPSDRCIPPLPPIRFLLRQRGAGGEAISRTRRACTSGNLGCCRRRTALPSAVYESLLVAGSPPREGHWSRSCLSVTHGALRSSFPASCRGGLIARHVATVPGRPAIRRAGPSKRGVKRKRPPWCRLPDTYADQGRCDANMGKAPCTDRRHCGGRRRPGAHLAPPGTRLPSFR